MVFQTFVQKYLPKLEMVVILKPENLSYEEVTMGHRPVF
jgi:hypothetical protein